MRSLQGIEASFTQMFGMERPLLSHTMHVIKTSDINSHIKQRSVYVIQPLKVEYDKDANFQPRYNR